MSRRPLRLPSPPGLSHRVQGAIGAAFSTGPGYEPQPLGCHISTESVRGYYLDLRRKAAAEMRPRLNGRGELTAPGPTALAQAALGLHERIVAGDATARTAFLAAVARLRAAAVEERDVLLWRYATPVPKYGLTPPWYSCMAQGQAASAFVRAYALTDDDDYAEAALAALRPLHDDALGLLLETSWGPVLQECASSPPSHVLNGWIFALWGLWDARTGLGSVPAELLFKRSAIALGRAIASYDHRGWSRYSLYPPTAPDLAKPFYHRIHVDQLEATARLTGSTQLAAVAARWRAADRPARRALVVLRKTPAVIRA